MTTGMTADMESGDADGRERGIAMHLMLQTLTTQALPEMPPLPASVACAIGRAADDPEVQSWWLEAMQTVRHPEFSFLFVQPHFDRAFNEVPVQYLDGEVMIYGIIDRLVLSNGTAFVIDYKTHRSASAATVSTLAGNYRGQMRLYSQGISKVWPDMKVRPCLLFTACRALVAVDDPASA
jgi:ATP-dependent helicase/nuclease subunit A